MSKYGSFSVSIAQFARRERARVEKVGSDSSIQVLTFESVPFGQ